MMAAIYFVTDIELYPKDSSIVLLYLLACLYDLPTFVVVLAYALVRSHHISVVPCTSSG